MTARRSRTAPFLAAALALALAACDGGGGTGSATPRLTVRLTDAPGDLAEAWVRIDRIYLQGTSPADSASGRVELLGARTDWVDLLTLSGGRTSELVGAAPVPPGTYSQLRFVVCEAWVRTRAGTVFATPGAALPAGVTATGTLRIPSGCQSGIKVKLPGGAVALEDETTILVVDFDVAQSFGHEAGRSGQWVMRPVLTATEVGFSGGVAGRVALAAGVTLPACGGGAVDLTRFVPLAVAGADSVSGATAADGTYRIAPLAARTYTLAHAGAVSFTNGDTLRVTATAAPATVAVAGGATATADYTVTAAACDAAG